MKSSLSSAYRTHPVHLFPWLTIETGHFALAQALLQAINQLPGPHILVIDGFIGLPWHDFITRFRAALTDHVSEVRWLSTETCLRPSHEIQALLESSLTQDPVFGRIFRGTLEEFWVPEQLAALQTRLATNAAEHLTIIYGFGASRVTTQGIHVYVDVPK